MKVGEQTEEAGKRVNLKSTNDMSPKLVDGYISGYKFKEWNTDPMGTGTRYTDEQVINSWFASDLTLYAIWEKA